jgi:hypothetical protein
VATYNAAQRNGVAKTFSTFDIRDCAGLALGTISLFVTRRNSSTAVLSSHLRLHIARSSFHGRKEKATKASL